MAQMVKNLPANAGDTRDVGSIPGLGRFPGGGHGKLLQHSCLENPMDREAHGQRIHEQLHMDYSPWGHKTVRHDLVSKQQQ